MKQYSPTIKRDEYAKKLKDPRWQRKRLEILERDNFTCQRCHDNKSTLNVHHRRYLIDVEPWDYPDKLLVTLCEPCHEYEKQSMKEICDILIEQLQDTFLSDDIQNISDGFNRLDLDLLEVDASYFSDMLKHLLYSIDFQRILLIQHQHDIINIGKKKG